MTTEEKKAITNFIEKIATKEYSKAESALEGAIGEKITTKVRAYLAQTKEN